MSELPPHLRAEAEAAYQRKLRNEPPPPINGPMRWLVRAMLAPIWVAPVAFAAVMGGIFWVLGFPTGVVAAIAGVTFAFELLVQVGLHRRISPETRDRLRARLR